MTTPTELIKCIQQLENKKHIKARFILSEIQKKYGYFGMYRGYFVTLNRELIKNGTNFLTYHSIRNNTKSKNSLSTILIGGFSGKISLN